MTDPTGTAGFAPLGPGFEFMQSWAKSAGAALPGMGQWVAPTLDPEEIAKRIQELRTVQFWLEQNARLLAATIQAMEVQKMTLTTLKTMNVQMGDLRESMKIRMPETPTGAAAGAAPTWPSPFAAAAPASAPASTTTARAAVANDAASPPPPPGLVDPMQWWGALTRQFTELASTAMKDGGGDTAPVPSADPPAGPNGIDPPAAPGTPAERSPGPAAAARTRSVKPAVGKKPLGER